MSALEAFMEVVNTTVDPIFSNTSNNDFVFYTSTSNQSIHFGTQTGSAPSALQITRSNLSINGDLALTRSVNIKGLKVSARDSAGTLQNVTTTVSAIPSMYPAGTDLTLKLTTPQTQFKFLNSNNTQIATLSQTGTLAVLSGVQVGANTVALSNHQHDASVITSGTIATARLPTASTSAAGIVQLNDTLASTSTTLAATANAAKTLNDTKLNLTGGTLTGKLMLNPSTNSFPTFGTTGGNGDRLIVYPGTASEYPYSIGVELPELWYGVPGTSRHSFYVGNARRLVVIDTGATVGGLFSAVSTQMSTSDTVTAPSYSWSGDSDTGMYHATTNAIGFSCGGTNILSLTSNDATIAGTLNATTLQQGGTNVSTLFAASNHTHDLTTSSITGILPLTKGGTGISTATGTTGTGNIVLSTGATINATSLQQNSTNVSLAGHTHTTADITSGVFGVAFGGTGQSTLTANKVVVGNGTTGVLTPSNLHWDNVNQRLGINQVTPSQALDVTGNIYCSGDVTVFSDARVKTNLQRIESALDKIQQLTGYTYERSDINENGQRHVGLIAQDVYRVMPEAVNVRESDGMMSVAYGNLIALLIEAVKELAGR